MTNIEITYCGRVHAIRQTESIKLSTQVCLADNAINIYGVPPATEVPLKYEDNLARVASGGSCNASIISLAPHCHGTHTECIGHILPEIYNVANLEIPLFVAATLVHVSLARLSDVKDSYNIHAGAGDWVITADAIERAISPFGSDYLQALVVVTGNDAWLPHGNGAPYFSHQAMALLRALGVQHLLVDIPSIDKLHDGGFMDNHRYFWGVSNPRNRLTERKNASVTELIKVPPNTNAGHYFICIQLPDLTGEALPSKPLLFPFS